MTIKRNSKPKHQTESELNSPFSVFTVVVFVIPLPAPLTVNTDTVYRVLGKSPVRVVPKLLAAGE